ncbi:hypothetical protein FANTH_13557 [Fusarium anthophilum]|uniref:C2H2-type domain-containing protein n=1 Tax=Fusarium anthophilum TaxID=48485 RepID=A0A8H4YN05_9HYPO|nr:hypothetical protein FANTH_13557 [Fusarium anthophilum]
MDYFVGPELYEPISPRLIDLNSTNLEHLQLAYPSPQPSELNTTSQHVDTSSQFDFSFDSGHPIERVPCHSSGTSAMRYFDDQDTGPCLDPIQYWSDQEHGIGPYIDFSSNSGAGSYPSARSPDLSVSADWTRDSHCSWGPPFEHQTTSQPPSSYNWDQLNLNGIQPTSRDATEPIESQDSSPAMYQLLNHVWKLDDSNLLSLKVLIDQRVSGSYKTEPSSMLQDQNILSHLGDSMSKPLNSQSPAQSDGEPTDSKPLPLCLHEKPSNPSDPQSNPPSVTQVDYDMMRYPCGFPNCKKTFKRKEHAKRHYST